MSPVACSDADKEWFDEFQNEDETQAEAFSRLVDQAKAFEGDVIDEEELAEELKSFLGSACEVGAFRGTKAYHEQHASESNTGP